MMPLIRYWILACSLRTCNSPLAAESCVTPGNCSSTLSRDALLPCGSASIAWWLIRYEVAPIGATIFWRTSSNLSFLPVTTWASVGGGGAAGVSRRCPVVTRVRGRRGGCARRGSMTSIFGSAVLPPPAGDAVCDIAAPPRPSSSDAELERRRVVLTESVIIPDPDKAAARFVVVYEFEKRLPSMCDGPISIYPGGIGRA